jgi:asparagine synthase (glutamine-hydrolysing)
MCGIAGFVINRIHNYNCEYLLNTMLDRISHRGNDNRGTFYNKSNDQSIGLGHNRLSIIDTSDRANQPYHFLHYTLVFNGEIYNYRELWDILIQNNYTLDTTSDTEVVIKMFDLFKEKSFSYLNGMFAIVIYDNLNNKIFLVRDRMGVKPLIYYYDNNHFYFASEIKSIYKGIPVNETISINTEIVDNYFKYGYVNSFVSIFSNIRKLKNGHYLVLDLDLFKIEEKIYWNFIKSDFKINNINFAYQELRELVINSVQNRLVSDVGFGIFLSSGIDSNLVLNIILESNNNKINSYTYKGVDNISNEDAMIYNSNIINQIDVTLSDDQLWEYYLKLCQSYDEPFSDPATVGLYGLSLKAKELNKVILVGDGGDELLGGYNSYEELYYFTRPNILIDFIKIIYYPFSFLLKYFFKKKPFAKHLNKIHLLHSIFTNSTLFDVLNDLENRYIPIIQKITNRSFKSDIVNIENKNSIISFLNYKVKTELVHQLNYKTDIAGMLNTIEIREPLLDYRLFELQQKFSDNLLFDKKHNISNKFLYRKILTSFNSKLGTLKKKGFKVDLDRVFKNKINEIDEIINSSKYIYINEKYVKYLWKKYKSNNVDFVIMNRVLSYLIWENNLTNRL